MHVSAKVYENIITPQDTKNPILRASRNAHHQLTNAFLLFFGHQGELYSSDYEAIMNKASCLSVVSNAILYWNTLHISERIIRLLNNGDEMLSHFCIIKVITFIPSSKK